MERKIGRATLMIAVLLMSMALMANLPTVKANGTIYIRADGSIDPPTAPIQRNGDIYTFTANIYDSIVVQRSNIVVDGAYYSLQGLGSGTGFRLDYIKNTTITRTNIKNWYTNIELFNSSFNTISGNNITGGGWAGIEFGGGSGAESSYNTITRNNITNNKFGIYFGASLLNTIFENNITNNGYGIEFWFYANNNSIFKNKIKNNGYNIRIYTDYNSIYENDVSASIWHGVWLSGSWNSLSRNNITNNGGHGILIEGSFNTISENTIEGNGFAWMSETFSGVVLGSGFGNVLRNNTMVGNKHNFDGGVGTIQDIDTSNIVEGKPIYYLVGCQNLEVPLNAGYVALVNSMNISVKNLNLTRNGQGVLLANTTNSEIINNFIADNVYGIRLHGSSNNYISENHITNNIDGIYLDHASGNSIVENRVTGNKWCGVLLETSSNNLVHHNNFQENTQQISSTASINIWDAGYPLGGNYWSDYNGVDIKKGPNQDQPGSDGIGDTAYTIDANNTDRYPLMNPYGATPPPTYILTITATLGGTINPAPGSYVYSQGQIVPVQALPYNGYYLDYWEFDGVNIGSSNPLNVTMDTNHMVNAIFARIPGLIADIAVTNVMPSKTVVGQGYSMNVNVTVANHGDYTETFDVTLYADSGTPINESGLVGYWNFDEGTGTIAHDSSGNNNDGTIYGATWTSGKIGNALQFDGIDDYVFIENSPSLQISQSITVAAWIRVEGITGDHQIILGKWYGYEKYPSYVLEMQPDGQTAQFCIFNSTGARSDAVSSVTIPIGEWAYIVGTYDGHTVKIYVNGVLVGTSELCGPINVENQLILIGAHTAWWDRNWFNGIIDEVKVYNRSLSAEEVWAEYTRQTGFIIGTQTVTLESGASTTLTFTWNTTGFAKGNYTIWAYAWPVQGETDTVDNTFMDGIVTVTIPGDVDGDFEVRLVDLVHVAIAYGSKLGEPKWNPNADIDNNSIVGLTDLVILAKNYGKTDPQPSIFLQ